ncbi:haloacid dehalogenase [Halobellus salinus]|uniref:Haloacid dehalogenase n=1 Tax=Halobellus salinus TaxID=931585 RepID=A0A830EKD6_9EURY|nr:HAD-IIA family hydrolase [Halobellus salinus]GGI99541.1 haloacid dehalogenase [Halobellus salinus]SMP04593.1 arabinose operon protein AraL [Halobellus salinus]
MSGYEAAVLDLDGTVYLGDSLIPGVDAGIRRLRESVGPVRFLTNKPIARRRDYRDKLRRLGIDTELSHVINSGWVTAQYVSDRYPEAEAFVVGESPLIEEFHDAGVDTTTDATGDLVVASMDREFDYEDLDIALQTLETGDTPFVATNPDRTCPTESGVIPDAAGMIGAIEGVTGRTVDEVLGKPSPRMIETTLEAVGVDPADCLMMGDRIETDILMGERAGMTTVLVLSGVTDREMLRDASVGPDYVLESLAAVGDVLEDR